LPERFTLIKEFLMEQNLSTLNNWPAYHNLDDEQDAQDHFIVRDGVSCAGAHLIVDIWGVDQLDDLELMERAMREAVEAAKATLLHIHLHHFTPNGGISGVAVLAESHISVHTWPERQFAAFDIFMCGDAKPELAVEVLRTHFHPGQFQVQELLRGRTGSYGDI
jgi:S-adenosylmethionine decarboxylase|tara:strand:- start:7678 stop:8169 length:492 start_codon:yes stop_codon:yes gene_type:complete